MAAQVQRYLGQKPANIATALHLFWGGTNDVFDYPDPLSAEQNAVLNISNQIASIAAAGGQNFVWLNLPPLDLSPRGAGSAGIGTASTSFATDMQRAISSLQASYPGITIISVDVYSLFKQVIQTPAQYGLTNVTTQAQGYPVNPDQYIFWDYLHPTTKMHQLIAGLVRSDITSVLDLPSAPTKLPVSDDFTSTGLNTDLWTVEAPPDATVTVASGHSILSLPGGVNHDAFVGGNNSVRILQPVSNVDFDVAAKFDTVLSAAYQGQGILVQQDAGTYLRFEVGSNGAELFLSGASVSGGTETNHFSTPLHGVDSSLWLEVKRSGDTWTLSFATDGVNYTAGGTFIQSINVTGIGPYAFNYNSYAPAAPATSSSIDFFHNLIGQ
jgi:lysophospholipase L1-like esterase